jgi:[ribosomal protein S5]-alanine N-acetyltransferase
MNLGEAMLISRERITLQAIAEKDVTDKYVSWLNDPEVVRFSNQRFYKHSKNSSLVYLNSFLGSANYFLKIENNDLMIGTMTAYISPQHGIADIGIMIGDRSSWGQGYGLEAWVGLMSYLFEVEGLRKVTGGTARGNIGMIKIFERSGMQLEAIRPLQVIIDGKPMDQVCFGKFNEL